MALPPYVAPVEVSPGQAIAASHINNAASGVVAALAAADLTGAKTLSAATSLTFPAQPSRAGQLVMHGLDDPAGVTARNIVFIADGTMARPGPVWVDSAGRTQVWSGWHDLVVGGGVHHSYEVKTSTDPAGSFPAVLATRFRIQSDQDQGYAAFFSTGEILHENGTANNASFGITWNTPMTGSVIANTAGTNYKAGRLSVQVDSGGAATMHIAPGLDNTTASHLSIFRSVNNTTADVLFFKGDNTNTVTAKIDCKTGVMKCGSAATGSRPSASGAGVGGMFYDTTLSKPIWSDGTVWRDAAGTTV